MPPRGVQVIPPRNDLRRKAVNYKKGVDLSLTPEVLQKLEAVIETAKDEMSSEVGSRLRELRNGFQLALDNPDEGPKFQRDARDTSFEIKGMGGMFGYPLLTEVAKSLNDFLSAADTGNDTHMQIVGLHIDALYVILANRISGAGEGISREVVASLKKAVAMFSDDAPSMLEN